MTALELAKIEKVFSDLPKFITETEKVISAIEKQP